jgi:hypothetical protein
MYLDIIVSFCLQTSAAIQRMWRFSFYFPLVYLVLMTDDGEAVADEVFLVSLRP